MISQIYLLCTQTFLTVRVFPIFSSRFEATPKTYGLNEELDEQRDTVLKLTLQFPCSRPLNGISIRRDAFIVPIYFPIGRIEIVGTFPRKSTCFIAVMKNEVGSGSLIGYRGTASKRLVEHSGGSEFDPRINSSSFTRHSSAEIARRAVHLSATASFSLVLK